MKIFTLKKYLTIFSNLKFAIIILAIIALTSSFGSFIEQDESSFFYEENYPVKSPIYGFLNANFILNLGLDHIYTTWWFLLLLVILGTSLISCTITRQFPLLSNSKEYFFRRKQYSFLTLPFFIKLKNIYYLKENILLKIQKMNFYIYQKGNLIYGYKGLIGRISPILVHFSLIIILLGSSIGALQTFKAQEILPKGELFHIQNTIKLGWFTSLPNITTRVNDFWVEYKNNRIHQFYSNISLLNNYGIEIKEKTISVNNPLRYKNIDFYQSDWNLLGVRVKDVTKDNTIYEFPLFPLKKNSKSWITWITNNEQSRIIVFDQLQNNFIMYDKSGNFLKIGNLGDSINSKLFLLDILPATGLQIKYDPSILIIYFGFGLLMITACLSYLPYTQIWIFNQKKSCWVGSLTNRGKIKLEIEFENLIRYIENMLSKNIFVTSKEN
jgi:cytochrome c biogenesis protein